LLVRLRNAAIVVSPFALSICLVYLFGVNFLYYDEWEFFPIFEKFKSGTLSLSDFLAQHTESRMLVPRVLVLTLGLISGWNVKIEMYFIQLLQMGIALLLLVLAKKTIPKERTLLACFIASVLLSSFCQWRNFITSFQVVMYLPNFFLVLALLISQMQWKDSLKISTCALLAILATLSFANGLLLWIVLPLSLFGLNRSAFKKQAPLIAAWTALAVATIALYFRGFEHPAEHPGIETLFYKPAEVLHGFLLLTSLPFRNETLPANNLIVLIVTTCGIALSALFTVIFLGSKDSSLQRKASPWIALSAYGFATLLIIACGRTEFGEQALLAPRYGAFAVYAWIPLIFLQTILIPYSQMRFFVISLFALCIPAHIAMSLEKIPALEKERQYRHRGINAVQLLQVAWRYDVGRYTTPDGDKLLKNSELLSKWGYRPQKLSLETITFHEKAPSVLKSNIENAVVSASNDEGIQVAAAEGWLQLPGMTSKSLAVVATVRSGSKKRKISTYAHIDRHRPQLAKRLSISPHTFMAWSLSFRKLQREKMEFWVLDTISGDAYPILTPSSAVELSDVHFSKQAVTGNFDYVKKLFGQWHLFSGWLSPELSHPLLITRQCGVQSRQIELITFPGLTRVDVAKELGETHLNTGWQTAGIIAGDETKASETQARETQECRYEAWAYDKIKNSAHPVGESIRKSAFL
jgi:hypothetical protein